MTEQEWLACHDPQKLLDFVRKRVSDRKLRLFAVACCRRIDHMFAEPQQRESVDAAERYADGLATDQELEAARIANDFDLSAPPKNRAAHSARKAAYFLAIDDAYWAALERRNAAYAVIFQADAEALERWQEPPSGGPSRRLTSFTEGDLWLNAAGQAAAIAEATAQCELLREICGSPFRAITVAPSWLTCNVIAIAQAIYDERAFDRLPILADALEDVGCTNEAVLAHCRGPGTHVRGCWVVNVLLRKE